MVIKISLDGGLPEDLASAFPAVVPAAKAQIEGLSSIFDSLFWLAGFASAEGSFIVSVFKSKTVLGYAVRLTFQLTQHSRDELLLTRIAEYIGCGKIYKDKEAYIFKVTKLSDINDRIIPLFLNHPILGVKSKDFSDLCKTRFA